MQVATMFEALPQERRAIGFGFLRLLIVLLLCFAGAAA